MPAEFAPNPGMVGTVTGLMNGFGNIAGIVSPALIGALLTATGGSFDLALIVLGATCLIGAASFHYITGEIAPIPPTMVRGAAT
jgi:nitrate/nitrite transporter NarK